MDKAKFKYELTKAVNQIKPDYHIVAEMTLHGYHGTIPAANGIGEIVDYDELSILSADVNSHLFVFIGDFTKSDVYVRVEAHNILAFRYNILDDPKVVLQVNPNLAAQLGAHHQGQEVLDIMNAVYYSFLKA